MTAKHSFRSIFFNKVAGWKPEIFRSSHWRCSVKQGVFKNFANFTGNNLCWSLFLIKLDIWCLKLNQRRLQPGAFCKICNYFEENLCMSTCKLYLKKDSKVFVSEFCKLFRSSYFAVDLQTTSSETPARGSLNKFVSLAARRSLTVLERE